MNKNLGLRKAVGIILARDDGKIWTGKRKIGIGVRPNEKKFSERNHTKSWRFFIIIWFKKTKI